MLKSQIRRDEYLVRAERALELAAAATLYEVRRRHEAAAAVWQDLAAAEHRSSTRTIEAIARVAQRAPRPPPPGSEEREP